MKKTAFLVLFLLSSLSYLNAQHEFDKWIFGKSTGLDFTGGSPTVINSTISGWDNCGSIADSSGNLLFSSEGMHIYDKNGNLMPHGGGLLGDTTGGQPATIVRKPCSSNLYYLFTNEAFAWPNGFRYSIIDMNLNGGLGDVDVAHENVLVLTPNTEGVTTIVHANGHDVWVLIHEMYTNVFRAYLLTGAGLNTNYVASAIGSVHGDGNVNDAIGELTRTAAGDKVACGIFDQGKVEIFNFDNATGVLSNPISVSGYHSVIGVEFSPDGYKLYSTQLNAPDLTQFDLSVYNQTTIANSATTVGTIPATDGVYNGGYMTLGPDNKIYVVVTFSNTIGRINSPNSLGTACNYDSNAISLGSKFVDAGLVDKIAITSQISGFSINNNTICSGDSAKICAPEGFTSYLWNNSSTGLCMETKDTGTYYVVATDSNGCSAQSNNIDLTAFQPAPVTIMANKDTICSSDSAQICAPAGYPSYAWNIGATSQCIQVKYAGNYYVTVSENSGCSAESNHLGITVFPLPPVAISRSGDTLKVYNSNNVQWYLNSNAILGATQNTYIAPVYGDYGVSVTDSNGCTSYSLPIVYTGIDNISNDENISVKAIPNPFNQSTHIFVSGVNTKYDFDLFDVTGRLKKSIPLIENNQFELDCNNYSPGIYFYRISVATKPIAFGKLVIQ